MFCRQYRRSSTTGKWSAFTRLKPGALVSGGCPPQGSAPITRLCGNMRSGSGSISDWHGAFFIDYFYDQVSGQPEYIECNPRIGETVNAMLSGINLPELLVRISSGESPSPAPLGRFGVQTHNLLMILMSAAYEGQSRRALMHEIQACAAGRGLYANSEDELIRPQDDPLSRLPRLWITLRLLAYPAIARRIVAKTIANYALPEFATEAIKKLPLDLLDRTASQPISDESLHVADGLFQPDHKGSRNDAVADI